MRFVSDYSDKGGMSDENRGFEPEQDCYRDREGRHSTTRQDRAGKLAIWLYLSFIGVVVCGFVAQAGAKQKKPKPVPCGPTITKCGCTIMSTGFYQVAKNLGLPGGALNESDDSCIAVSAPRVGLYLAGMSVTNSLTSGGIGIHLDSTATDTFLEGAGGTLSGWNYGVQDDADGAIMTNLSADNNTTAGFFVERATGMAITNFGAHGNGQYGVLLNGALVGQISGGSVNPPASGGIQNNGIAGIEVNPIFKPFQASSGIRIFGNCVTGNLGSGIVLDTSVSKSRVSGNEATGNTAGDLIDHNNNCGTNLWFGNSFGVGSPITCVGQGPEIDICPQS
jgi:parallel beta-helix repeat protein